jgi:hypothetical protein
VKELKEEGQQEVQGVEEAVGDVLQQVRYSDCRHPQLRPKPLPILQETLRDNKRQCRPETLMTLKEADLVEEEAEVEKEVEAGDEDA